MVNSVQSGVTQTSYTLVNAGTVGVRLVAVLRLATGAVFTNAVYRFSAVQLDRGPSRLTYRYLPAAPAQARSAMGILPTIPAWASVTSAGAIEQGSGIVSVAVSGGTFTVTLATAMPNTTYGVLVTPLLAATAARFATISARTTTQFTISFWSASNVAASCGFSVAVLGA
jgi:hypothetical protein